MPFPLYPEDFTLGGFDLLAQSIVNSWPKSSKISFSQAQDFLALCLGYSDIQEAITGSLVDPYIKQQSEPDIVGLKIEGAMLLVSLHGVSKSIACKYVHTLCLTHLEAVKTRQQPLDDLADVVFNEIKRHYQALWFNRPASHPCPFERFATPFELMCFLDTHGIMMDEDLVSEHSAIGLFGGDCHAEPGRSMSLFDLHFRQLHVWMVSVAIDQMLSFDRSFTNRLYLASARIPLEIEDHYADAIVIARITEHLYQQALKWLSMPIKQLPGFDSERVWPSLQCNSDGNEGITDPNDGQSRSPKTTQIVHIDHKRRQNA